MRDLARQVYEICEVGSVGWIRPDRLTGFDLEIFQSVEIAVEDMQADGLVSVIEIHRESQSGKRQIDAIQFRRLK